MTVSPSDEEIPTETESVVEHPKSPLTNVSEVDEGKDEDVDGHETVETGAVVDGDVAEDGVEATSSQDEASGGVAESGWPHDEEYIVEYRELFISPVCHLKFIWFELLHMLKMQHRKVGFKWRMRL